VNTKAKTTARFYAFEETIETLPAFAGLRARRSIADLQLAAGCVWAGEGGKGDCPSVRPRGGERSYYVSATRMIELIPKHRNLASLLHELAHALGTRDKLDHGPAFRKRCIRLYREYGGWDGEVTWDKPTSRRPG
jgi:hypothetical protein